MTIYNLLLTVFIGSSLVACASSTSNREPDGDCTLSETQQAFLDAHNEARASARTCGTDNMPVAPPLTWQCQLQQAATSHSEDMAGNNIFSHTGSDGLSPFDRIRSTGYSYSAAAENIFAGTSDVNLVMQGWLDSPGHCRNIMNADYVEMAVALAENADSDYGVYLTSVFAAPR